MATQNLVLDPILAQKVMALFPISEGNQAQQLPVYPVAPQIVAAYIINPLSLSPYRASGTIGSSGDKVILVEIPAGFHLMINSWYIWNSGGADTKLYDGDSATGTQVWNFGALSTTPSSLSFSTGLEFRTRITIYTNNSVNTNYSLIGYYERISNV